VRGYAVPLRGPLGDQPLRGYLTGSVDVVLRVPADGGGHRYLVVDYKTNWLGDLDAPLSAHDYRPAVLDEAMGHSDYPLQALRGFLTGSIDAVLRLPGPVFAVVDYKTNRLGAEPLSTWHYRPEAMAEAMMHAHYPLQLLLYAAALHRFLRWRQPGYDPAVHLGGVLYLYLRGMCGPETPLVDGEPCGVFAWQPPVALVEELSDLLDGPAGEVAS
jgi:ATP-dependent exoDNAse (exonuclease V) beta subunit